MWQGTNFPLRGPVWPLASYPLAHVVGGAETLAEDGLVPVPVKHTLWAFPGCWLLR
jgi:hypothetical protein